VDEYLDALRHPRIAEIRRLRRAILDADADLVETIKWNAPSFGYPGTDRVTLRLQPGDRLEVVCHRGTAKRDDGFGFDEDPVGLLAWAAADRGVVAIADAPMLDARLPDIVALVKAWLLATSD
jgi:hypothetical protein